MKLSVIIVNFNTSGLTLDCIRSILRHAPQCRFEIIVVDNGSEDDSSYDIRCSFPEVRFIEVGKNTGYAAANNLGILNAQGEFLVLLNSDTKLTEEMFTRMIQHMELHPGIGVLGPRQIDREEKYQLSCGRFPTLSSELIRKIWHYRLSIDDYEIRDYLDSKFSSLTNVDWVSGSCMMIRRSVLARTRLLDERFFMYFEDIDLCRRVWNEGFAVQYSPDVTLVHYGGESAKQNLMKVMTEYRRSQIYFTRKYYGYIGEFFIRGLLLLKYLFNLMKWGSVFLISRFLRRDTARSFTFTLLSKKVTLGAFHAIEKTPIEPALPKPGSKKKPKEVKTDFTGA